MPPTAFTPGPASVHSNVLLDPSSLGLLRAEDFLLVHSCRRRAERDLFEDFDKDGRCMLSVHYNPRLIWSVQADALALDGLANYHPGLALDTHGLAFLNGANLPFLFAANTGTLIYDNATQDPEPGGGLVAVGFDVVLKFGGLTQDPLPETPPLYSSFQSTPPVALGLVDLPDQDAVELSLACRHALLLDAFNAADSFEGAPVLARFYHGNPASGGAVASGNLTFPEWTSFAAGAEDYIHLAGSPALTSTAFSVYERTATWVRLLRNGVVLADVELDDPFVIPAYYAIRLPAGCLPLQLTWPIDGASYSSGDMPSRYMLGYAVAGTRDSAGLTSTVLVKAYTADPVTSGTEVTSFTANADAGTFSVSGVTVTVNATGPTNSSGSPWSIGSIEIEAGTALPFLLKEFLSLSVANTAALVLDGEPVLNLAAPPDP